MFQCLECWKGIYQEKEQREGSERAWRTRPDLLKERISSLRGEKWETAGGAPEEPYPLSPAPHRYPCVPGKALGNESHCSIHPTAPGRPSPSPLPHPRIPCCSHTLSSQPGAIPALPCPGTEHTLQQVQETIITLWCRQSLELLRSLTTGPVGEESRS